ncbi:mitotic checkpoint protein BUB3.3 isoform X1 [Nicotiana sylvestris]|uniref:Mitotic checkpoint protein BUB3.3 n=1 Tax=Nicotiana sylvestris TaxID=4096 RepID=A0A1U7X7Q8_NICSY|nr:PREDICTED: mitotic checkpoint protein BUB3.3 [Nicotiana sylvestris]XP_009788127.1 PREDICTED: mitotic checkpoint protein BUB3.3 [Nicotiana sylvestris]
MNTISLNLEDPIRDAISRIRFGPHSNNLLISSWDSSLRLYDVDSSKLRMEAPGKAALLDCCFENENVCLSAASDGSVYRYDLDSGVKVSVGIHDDVATCVEYSPTTCQIISAGWDRKINFWDARSTQSHGCLNSLASEVESISLSGFCLMVAAGSSVDIYDLRSFKKSVHTKGVKVKCVRPIFNPKGFIVGSVDGRVLLEYICRSSSDEGYAFRCHPKSKDGKRHLVTVNDIAFDPSIIGSFVTGDNDGYVTLWDARGRKRMFEMPRYPKSVVSLSYSHDGLLLAVASSYAYQEANEIEEPPQIFIHEMGNFYLTSPSSGASKYK